MDEVDRKILRILQADAATPIGRIAYQVNLSQTPCWNRIRRMESEGIIRGRVAVVDPRRLDLHLTVFVEIEAGNHSREWNDGFCNAIATLPEVMECHRMAGETDYLLKVLVRDVDAYDVFYTRLTSVVAMKKVTAHFSLEPVFTRTVMPA